MDLESDVKPSVVRLPQFTGIRGVAWSPDDEQHIYGLVEHESRILLFDGLGRND